MIGNHVVWYNGTVKRIDRNILNNHKSGLIWFTGLSASGKSTIAHSIENELLTLGIRSYVLDGDNIRHGLNADLGFSKEERRENIRRIVEVSKLMVDAGILVLAAFISPFKKDREFIRNEFKDDLFVEVYLKCSLQECESRDPKGLYEKAKSGFIKNYTGISSPYEEPDNPELIINTEIFSVEHSISKVLSFIYENNLIQLT